MIVHEDKKDKDGSFKQNDECYVVKQYERRAISIHVINILRNKRL